ncbi:MAG TPA: hypothetical protein VM282_26930 [Acidimicrobiales bacterium]|nr:hypothetical protein [Acidimicrobiales bacterium]
MIIELVGCPGSGKTTLVPTIIEVCRRQGIVARHVNDAARPFTRRTVPGRLLAVVPIRGVESRLCWGLYVGYRGLYAARFAARNPRLVRHLWRTQRDRPSGADARERRVLHWYVRMMGSRAFLRRHVRDDEAIVFDEGFVHRVVQLHASGVEVPHVPAIVEYAGVIPEPDLVVNVQAPPHICVERISHRGIWTRMALRDGSDLTRFVDNAHRAVSVMVDEVRRKGWTIVDVDNGDDEPAIARRALASQLDNTVRRVKSQIDDTVPRVRVPA